MTEGDVLRKYIETFEELEVVLALARATERPASIAKIADAAGLAQTDAETAIERLVALGLVHKTPQGYYVDRRRPRTARAVAAIVRACEEDRLKVMAQLTSNAMQRVRSAAVRSFAGRKSGGGRTT